MLPVVRKNHSINIKERVVQAKYRFLIAVHRYMKTNKSLNYCLSMSEFQTIIKQKGQNFEL